MILTEAVADYLRDLHQSDDPILVEMYAHARREGIPVVHPETGALLEMMARAVQAKTAIEVGTAIGVSTLRLARGGTRVISFEIDEERHRAAEKYLARAGLSESVDLRLKDADEGLVELEGPFDLAFIDGPKGLYSNQVDVILPLLKPGGLMMIDNTLMSGSVATGVATKSWTNEYIEAVRGLNRRLLERRDLVATVTPIGDGVTIAVRGQA